MIKHFLNKNMSNSNDTSEITLRWIGQDLIDLEQPKTNTKQMKQFKAK